MASAKDIQPSEEVALPIAFCRWSKCVDKGILFMWNPSFSELRDHESHDGRLSSGVAGDNLSLISCGSSGRVIYAVPHQVGINYLLGHSDYIIRAVVTCDSGMLFFLEFALDASPIFASGRTVNQI